MTQPNVFVETNVLFGVFRMPSKRHRDALALKAQFGAGEVTLYLPYFCFQEARNLIAKSLPSSRCSDLLDYHRFAEGSGTAAWNFVEVEKLLSAALGEVSRTKAVDSANSPTLPQQSGIGFCTDPITSLTSWKPSTWTTTA